MNELQWVDFLKKRVGPGKGLDVGIGDDCAVVKVEKGKLLLKSDLFIEGVHFNIRDISFENIGKRAVARVLSDFSACCGEPKFIGVSLGMPKFLNKNKLKYILNGILKCAKKYKFSLVGGDTSSSDKLILDIWGVGVCKKPILRSGAKIGDYIFVTGKLGVKPFNEPFEPRLREARYLAKNFKINSMIDISDSFILDLYRILLASQKGALIDREAIPVAKGENSLYRGEDYELIFTIDKKEKRISVLNNRFYCVGKIVSMASGYKIKSKNKISKVKVKGYSHF